MAYLIDWNLSQAQFRNQVRDLIHQAEKRGKVLALPLEVQPGQVMLNLITLLLAQVNCEGCDAPCCRRNPNDEPIELLPPEYKRLEEKYGPQHFIVKDEKAFLPMPCPFLKQDRCSIYPARPIVCVIYPYQPGAVDGEGKVIMAVAASCPEAKRIARNIYMTAWRLRRQYSLLGEFNFLERILK